MKAALLIWHSSNRMLLESLLADVCEVIPPEEDAFTTNVDLIVVDGPALASCREELRRLKEAAEPLFLPILFLAPRPDIAKTATKSWELIDDVVTRPINRRELHGRVRNLLRARKLGMRLRDSLVAYEREHAIATSLQHAALPAALPDIPGFQFDAFYESAQDEANIGGDWYDAVCLNDGRILISVGDVAGSGLEAAVTMAAMRQAIRAVAQVYADPLTMLDAADRTLKEQHPGSMVTAFVGVVDPVTHSMKYASAGHPPPLLREPDGTITMLRAQSLPLGLRLRDDRSEAVARVAPGSLAVFYTDGLSESTRDVFDGERRLCAALEDPLVRNSDHPATAIKEAVFAGASAVDDVAVLAMRVGSADRLGAMRRWYFESADEYSAIAVRRQVVEELHLRGASADALFSSELIFGELLGNVVRYAPGPVEVVLNFASKSPVLHVLDAGRGFTLIPRLPTDLLSERGRGLFLIWTLGEDFNVDTRPEGGAHARVVLPMFRRNGAAMPSAARQQSCAEPVPQARTSSVRGARCPAR